MVTTNAKESMVMPKPGTYFKNCLYEAVAKVAFLGGMNSRPYVGQRLSVHRAPHSAVPKEFSNSPI